MSGAGACSAWNTLEGRVTSDLLDQPPNLGGECFYCGDQHGVRFDEGLLCGVGSRFGGELVNPRGEAGENFTVLEASNNIGVLGRVNVGPHATGANHTGLGVFAYPAPLLRSYVAPQLHLLHVQALDLQWVSA